MTESTTETTEQTEQQDRATKLRQAYTTANTRLREQYRDEFDSLYSQAAEELGVTYTPKPKPEQKAEAELQRLLTEFPHLRDKITEEQTA